ncbi:hypothetical protein [Planctomicrobium piriforme]|uniref:hypothetical protein n=1 Tax=Planctomicrobium piriforme TaxID=1576369 RepID=UPI000B86889C|nr:hypothetical protein [Planctomicrobium piriforme]
MCDYAGAFTNPEKLPSPWSRSCWKVYLNDEEAIDRAIRYVELNPVKEKKRRQHWSFVTPFHAESRRPLDDR